MGVNAAVAGFRGGFNRRTIVDDADEYLVARLRAGDDAAFEAIYDRYARGVLAFCAHMLGNREAAEDALQLTFVSAFRALRASDANVSLRPWLYTIARNRCLSELRTRRDVDVDDVATDRPSPEGVADVVQRREDFREMLDDLQRLPADQRAALVLFELADHSHEEIAAVLGVRKEKVKALVFQAREALVRGRRAREHPCAEIRERLATMRGSVLPRSVARAHIDRCPSCAAFEREIRRQRAALALILPVVLTGELKASVLGSALRGAGPVAAGGATAAAGVGGAGAVAASGTTAAAGVGGAGAVVAGGTTAAGGVSGASAVAAGASASIAGSVSAGTVAASTAAMAAGAPSVVAVAGAVTGVGAEYAASLSAVSGVGGLGAAGLLGKVLTAAAIATAGAGAIPAGHSMQAVPAPAAALVAQMPSSAPTAVAVTASAPATTLSPAAAASASAGVTTTTRVAPPSTTDTATTTIPAAPPITTATTTPAPSPSATATVTTTAPAAPPDSAATAPTTTPAAAASTTATVTTTAPAAPPDSAATAPTTTPAAAASATDATTAPAADSAPSPTTTPATTTDSTTPAMAPAATPSTDSTGTAAPSSSSTNTPTTTGSDCAPSTDSTVTATSAAPVSPDATTESVPVSSTS